MLVVDVCLPGDDVSGTTKRVRSFVEKPSHRTNHVEDIAAFGRALEDATLGKLPQITDFGENRRADAGHFQISNVIPISASKVSKHPSDLVGEGFIRAELSNL